MTPARPSDVSPPSGVSSRRSWLFVPGDRPERFERAFASGAHAVIVDLEDSVAAERIEAAREAVAGFLPERAPGSAVACYVRLRSIAPYPALHADLEAVVRPGLSGLVLPKVALPEQVERLDAALDVWEALRGLDDGSVGLALLLEAPDAVVRAADLAAASPRVRALLFGAEDYANAIEVDATEEMPALVHARASVALAARAAGVQAVDMVTRALDDAAAVEAAGAQARSLGFTGKLAIHPNQVPPIHAAFRPSAAEVEWARGVIDAYEGAADVGRGAVAAGREMVDEPVMERARRILREAAGESGAGDDRP